MDQTIVESGIAISAIVLAVASMRVLERYIDKRNGYSNGHKMQCPNRIESVAISLKALEHSTERIMDNLTKAGTGVDRLVEQHAPSNGVEQWKLSPGHYELWQDINKKQQVMVACLSQITNTSEKSSESALTMIELQREAVKLLAHNTTVLATFIELVESNKPVE